MQDANEATQHIEPLSDEYRNYKEERKHRQIAFRPSTAGKLQYQRIPMCGHKLLIGEEPRHRNCESCWFTLFQLHKELVESCDEVFKTFGEAGLAKIRGPKFAKNFVKFMSTLATWKKMATKETDGEVSTTTASGSGGNTAADGEQAEQGSLF